MFLAGKISRFQVFLLSNFYFLMKNYMQQGRIYSTTKTMLTRVSLLKLRSEIAEPFHS